MIKDLNNLLNQNRKRKKFQKILKNKFKEIKKLQQKKRKLILCILKLKYIYISKYI